MIESQTSIEWMDAKALEDLDFADEIAQLLQTYSQMQNKTSKLEAIAAKLGLKVNRDKSKIMRINEENSKRIKLETGELEDVAEFTYLGSKITFLGGTDEDIKRE
ncbi:Hypothetical predicted protein [Octopus vulgaris]|uniref:Reverse transcriptase domain-containing protein n=1 Tax=Octopus vulgaris TaxID=6645 RepID=A0AA36ARF6_OCTVU|nr:Hypothetical predicted protein [Octopus vulgaris]